MNTRVQQLVAEARNERRPKTAGYNGLLADRLLQMAVRIKRNLGVIPEGERRNFEVYPDLLDEVSEYLKALDGKKQDMAEALQKAKQLLDSM